MHVAIRAVLILALGAVGCSSLYWLFYLVAPALVAVAIAQKDGPRYLAEDGGKIARALGWLAGAYAYLWLLTDRPPTDGGADLAIVPSGAPTPARALVRIVTSLPALVVLALLTMVASVLWLVGAIALLASKRLPESIADFIALMLRYQFRLLAYHLSLVDEYPSLREELGGRHPSPTGA